MKYKDLKFPLYDSVYGSEFPTEEIYLLNFGEIPSRFSNNAHYDPTLLDYFISNDFVIEAKITSKQRKFDAEPTEQYLLISKKNNMIVKMFSVTDISKKQLFQFEILYDYKKGKIEDQLKLTELTNYERTKKKSNISLIKSDMGHLDTEDYDLYCDDIDLELNYGKDFLKVHDVIIKRLNKDVDKGIIFLHGIPGSGKTSYIKYLTKLIHSKSILFIPPSMAEMLSEPSIIPFLMYHKNSILIIEDAERVIADREGNGSAAGVSNLLNLTDGILGDCLNIQIIATFNMEREKIDQALLRKGRLIAEHKFDKLDVTATNKLLKHLGKNHIVNEGMVLADIYNIDVEEFKTVKQKNKIGFK